MVCSTCISGQQFSTRPHSADGRSHRFRATDIKISLGGPKDKIRMFLEKENVPYQVAIISMLSDLYFPPTLFRNTTRGTRMKCRWLARLLADIGLIVHVTCYK